MSQKTSAQISTAVYSNISGTQKEQSPIVNLWIMFFCDGLRTHFIVDQLYDIQFDDNHRTELSKQARGEKSFLPLLLQPPHCDQPIRLPPSSG